MNTKNRRAHGPFTDKFLNLMAQRRIENIDRARLDGGCLLCNEDNLIIAIEGLLPST
jgi:hypothetical protein